MIKVSCIIPTYNEQARIANVLSVVTQHPAIQEVVVIDDGSTDLTREIAAAFKQVTLIVHEKNKGKSAAIHRGITEAQGSDYLLFLDADLVGLTSETITELIRPVSSGLADVSISYRGNSPRFWRFVGFDYISGERVVRKSILDGKLDTILTLPKFGLEVFLNDVMIQQKTRIAIVPWPDVASPFKYAKHGVWKGIMADIRMMRDIFKTFSPLHLLLQIRNMKRLIIT